MLQNEQCSKPWLVGLFRGFYYIPFFIGIIISHCKHASKPISIMECHKGLGHGSHVFYFWVCFKKLNVSNWMLATERRRAHFWVLLFMLVRKAFTHEMMLPG